MRKIDSISDPNKHKKLLLFDKILQLDANQNFAIKKLVRNIAINGNIDRGGFEVVFSVINPIVKNTSLKRLIENSSGDYSNLTRLLFNYFIGGMHGMINYAINIKGKTPDNAIEDNCTFRQIIIAIRT